MTFRAEGLPAFYQLFEKVRGKIATFPGCMELRIYTDISDKTIIFTYSEWTSEQDLNNYRNSLLFRQTWSETKKLFKAPAEAWSIDTPS
jgi:heme-degrading monooxygenase HmoA